jgi:ribose/xylose/arabinose/galactoside ABC-type transport system permease subunit
MERPLVPRAGGMICAMTNAIPTAKTKIATTMDSTIWATVSALIFSSQASNWKAWMFDKWHKLEIGAVVVGENHSGAPTRDR